ncbi:MAG TPA: tetratricopeptide repeat protein, partial [Nannocystis exedens]|nr:tetratricopeptide repeat protein [Nannocystis exedens]
ARAKHAWRAAIDAYEELLELYPATPEAHNVQVQLGELLRRQGQPGRALGHFQAYLIRGGPLAAEARFGKVLALQQLGRSSDEAAAIAEFIRLHPHHIEADKLRQRARELEARTSTSP